MPTPTPTPEKKRQKELKGKVREEVEEKKVEKEITPKEKPKEKIPRRVKLSLRTPIYIDASNIARGLFNEEANMILFSKKRRGSFSPVSGARPQEESLWWMSIECT